MSDHQESMIDIIDELLETQIDITMDTDGEEQLLMVRMEDYGRENSNNSIIVEESIICPIDQQINTVREELEMIRKERKLALSEHETERRRLNMEIYRSGSKVQKMVKRGHDAKLYNQALQEVFSDSMPQQYVLQRQAMLLQMLHKTDICIKQIKGIQKNSNKIVNYMMVEASVIEMEQKELEKELMTKQGEFMNEKLDIENTYHCRIKMQTDIIQRTKSLLLPEKTNIDPKKFDEISVGTTDTFQESVDEYASTASPTLMREIKRSMSKMWGF